MKSHLELFAAASLIVVLGCAHAALAQDALPLPSKDSEELVRKHFERADGSLRLEQRAGELELCADVCDVFSWGKRKATREVWDFVLLYEYQRGVGTLEKVAQAYQHQVGDTVPLIIARYEQDCPGRAEGDGLLSCTLSQLAERNGIRVGFVEYDKGERCLAWADVKEPNKVSEYRCGPVKKK